MRRAHLFVPAVVLAVLLTGCGGGSTKSATDDPSSHRTTPDGSTGPASPGLTVTDGISPADLVTCLTTAGLHAAVDGSTPFGVEDPVVEIRVERLRGYDGQPTQGAYLWVFADPGTATQNASALTLGGIDEPGNNRYAVAHNVVRELDVITTLNPTADEAALLGCLPT